jgi:tyrosinase
MSAEPKSGVVGAKNRFDELHWVHITQSNIIHNVGDFLPWHRLYMRLHEQLLQDECNYTAAQPYWDEQRDADASTSLADAAVWGSDDLSFGTTNGGCVVDGAFANTTLHLNQYWGVANYTSYCMSRTYDDSYWAWANSSYSDTCMAKETYSDVWPCWSKYPHSSAHLAVGGTVSSVSTLESTKGE